AHTVHGASDVSVPVLLERLGIAEQMKAKTITRPGGYIGTVVAAGEAEIAVQQIVELLAVPGIEVVGPLPDEIQKVIETSAGIFAASKPPAAAEALPRFLVAPGAAPILKKRGLEQAGSWALPPPRSSRRNDFQVEVAYAISSPFSSTSSECR